MDKEQSYLIVNTILRLTDIVTLMIANWNNEDFVPPDIDEIRANIESLMSMTNLPEE
jgi:hypothetical protein